MALISENLNNEEGAATKPPLNSKFRVCCPECAIPAKCGACGAPYRTESYRSDSLGELVEVHAVFKCKSRLVYTRIGESFTPDWHLECGE